MWQVAVAVFWSWCVARFFVVVATSFVWFVWRRGGDVWKFFFVWNVASGFIDLLLLFCGLFTSYYINVGNFLLWSSYASAIGEWLVGVVV
jgi:hypothetical protein